MAQSKKTGKEPKKPSVKIEDMTPAKNPMAGKISIEYKEQPDGPTVPIKLPPTI